MKIKNVGTMNPRIRSIFAVVAGILVGAVVIFLIQLFSPYQPPTELDFDDKTKVADWIKKLPTSAFAIALLAYFLGSVAGGWITNLVAGPTRFRPALVTGFGLFIMGVMNLIALPHPVWFAMVSSLLYFAGAWIGGRLAARSK